MVYRIKDLMFDCSTWDEDGSNFVGLTGIMFDGCVEGPNGFFSVEVERFLDEELKEIYDELERDEEIENLRKQIKVIEEDIKICDKVLDTLQDTHWIQKYQEFKQGKIQLIYDLKLLKNELKLLEKQSRHCKKQEQCSYTDHCMCPFECTLFMVYDGCKKQQSDDLGWSVQAERDFIG